MERKNLLTVLLAVAVASAQPIESTVCPEHKHEDVVEELELELPDRQATIASI